MGRSKKKKGRSKKKKQPLKQMAMHEGNAPIPKISYAYTIAWKGEGNPAQIAGDAFVKQYYYTLLQSPETAHRFYRDSSFLSRQDVNGVMTTVTSMQAINEKILSLNYEDHTLEIQSMEAQVSFKAGIVIMVIGCLIKEDNVRKNFTQTFFLAPQDNGYFVLNDVFMYIERDELQINYVPPTNDINENTSAFALSPEPVCGSSDKKEEESVGAFMAQEDAPKKINASTRNKKAMRSLPECIPPYTLISMPWIPPSDQQSTGSEELEEAESDREGRNYSGNGGFYKKTSRNKWVPDSKRS